MNARAAIGDEISASAARDEVSRFTIVLTKAKRRGHDTREVAKELMKARRLLRSKRFTNAWKHATTWRHVLQAMFAPFESDEAFGSRNESNPCFGCGPKNRRGLGLRFHLEEGGVLCRYTPQADKCGLPGKLHLGVHLTILYESCYRAGIMIRGAQVDGSRGEGESRILATPPTGKPLAARARVIGVRGNRIRFSAETRSQWGRAYATYTATFQTRTTNQ
jgi:hypothetical protein